VEEEPCDEPIEDLLRGGVLQLVAKDREEICRIHLLEGATGPALGGGDRDRAFWRRLRRTFKARWCTARSA
jgi:hypothetical protein